ncbi:MAG: DUF3567 domain-containing protein [Methylibium sp.]|uniref:BTH_I0359 family protein n=1 Tax=Methylibium sp. TaxID=2067992 RepID=UPI0017A58AA4|nr:DUF3567 domain-containing protein [Methylibium sp.]MBA2723463.1 DUF3567 domain-containing protein [Methylibium sp.]MBA3589856.1 DUF3567 domain-containing protein [Methylibium sp.]MBA3625936.1 DUF3567 domain-containing protein [Methylibium sp.]
MHMLYNSDNFAVVQFVVSRQDDSSPQEDEVPARGGYEIVDKSSRMELFLDGALAEHFKLGVEALIETSPGVEEMDAFLANYTTLAHQPVVLH